MINRDWYRDAHLKNHLGEKRFDFEKRFKPLLEGEMKIFFNLGLEMAAIEIKPFVDTFDANIDGPMSDKDFRLFAKTIIDQIRECL